MPSRSTGIPQPDGSGTILASCTDDSAGVPTSVTVGSGSAAPRSSDVSTGHGDVVNLTDASGTVVASYADVACGVLTSSSETLPTGWTTPSRSDGRDGVRADGETGLSWMCMRCAPTTRASAPGVWRRWSPPRSPPTACAASV